MSQSWPGRRDRDTLFRAGPRSSWPHTSLLGAGQVRPSSLATRSLWAAARAHWASAEEGLRRVHPLDLCVMVRRFVTVSVSHCPGSWHWVSSQRGPESIPLGPGAASSHKHLPSAFTRCRAGGAEEGVGEGGGGEESEAAPNIVHVDMFGYLNFILCDQFKSQAPPGAVIGESTLTRELGIRKEQKETLILNY